MTHHQLQQRRRIAWGLIGILVGSLIVLQLWTVIAIRATQKSNKEKIDRTEQVVRLIRDCTDPTGTCYKRGQKRTADAIVGINQGTLRVVSAALSCQADGVTEQTALVRCTITRSTP